MRWEDFANLKDGPALVIAKNGTDPRAPSSDEKTLIQAGYLCRLETTVPSKYCPNCLYKEEKAIEWKSKGTTKLTCHKCGKLVETKE